MNSLVHASAWVTAHQRRMLVALVVCLGVFSLGLDWAIFRPGRLRAAALLTAQEEVAASRRSVADAKHRYELAAKWYLPGAGYIDALPKRLAAAAALLADTGDGAGSLLKQAAATQGYRATLALTERAETAAQAAAKHATGVTTHLLDQAAMRHRVRNQVTQLQAARKSGRQTVTNVAAQFAREREAYLRRYTTLLSAQLETAEQKMGLSATHETTALIHLPPDNDTSRSGHPLMAKKACTSAEATLAEATTLTGGVLRQLQYLAAAEADAEAKVASALTASAEARQAVTTLQQRTGYWLRAAEEKLTEASGLQAASNAALQAIVEDGRADKPAAYTAALASLAASAAATTSAEAEVALAAEVQRAVTRLHIQLADADPQMVVAQRAEATLRRHHAVSAWQDCREDIAQARAAFGRTRELLGSVESLHQLTVQRFAEAQQQAQAADGQLKLGLSRSQHIIDASARLEAFRRDYLRTYRAAQDVVDDQTTNISKYGSYRTGARDDYNAAVALLSQAAAAAKERRYQAATQTAQSATDLAKGTGALAYAAYQDHLEEEEEAARRRRRAASDDDDSSSGWGFGSSGGYDSGGSDWSSSSSSSSDWGSSSSSSDWGSSGSSSDWGGGSDSDFSSGSDSDW